MPKDLNWLMALVLLAGAVFGAVHMAGRFADPHFVVLTPGAGAQWIRNDEPLQAGLRETGENREWFRTEFKVSDSTAPTISYRALNRARVFVDGAEIALGESDPARWKEERTIALAEAIEPGIHEILFEVTNEDGPSLLWARSAALGIGTGEDWESSLDGETWKPTRAATEATPSEISREFLRSDRALFRIAPFLIPIFLLVYAWRLRYLRAPTEGNRLRDLSPDASTIRWALLGLWGLLALNNIGKLPSYLGFDLIGQMEYIEFLIEEKRLPLPTDGWKMFETPLFYAIATVPYRIFSSMFDADRVVVLLRILPLACAIAQIEVVYRSLKVVYPDRGDLQALGTTIAGLLPVHIYMSQFVNNQALNSILSSVAILMTFSALCREDGELRPRFLIGLGAVLGFAVLAKLTAIVLIPMIGLALWQDAWRRHGESVNRTIDSLKPAVVFGLSVGAVCGWYFVRNLITQGKPFAVGYDPALGIVWRQDPGFHTINEFLRFGDSLVYPVYASFVGFWDALYATFWTDAFLSGGTFPDLLPSWNFSFMLALPLLSIVPSAVIVLGAVRGLRMEHPGRRLAVLFSAGCLLLYLAAMAYQYLTLTGVSGGKATYALGALPCVGLLAAAGFERARRWTHLDCAVHGFVACWGVAAYVAFFVF